ncbi:MYND domain protein [Apiospora arundinis]|uniref:MYND domain protein n=1 Tax=Apiospora arundinis TaxID=335852 RepID=A0ABR2IGX5_9PEZI
MNSSCTVCKKTAQEVSLKYCAKCSKTPYCSRDCQKADWKAHKEICDQPASASTGLSPPKGLDQPITKPFTRLDNGTWLHDRPETDVYRLLLDTYRLRVEDNYTLEGDADEDSLYSGAPDGLRGFRRFLRLAKSRQGLLPPWWGPTKQQACERLGMDPSQWQDLRCAVEKSDIIEHYGDPRFPMQLRMLAEAVYRRGPGGMDGTEMRKMMAGMEQGAHGPDARVTTIDNTTMRASEFVP